MTICPLVQIDRLRAAQIISKNLTISDLRSQVEFLSEALEQTINQLIVSEDFLYYSRRKVTELAMEKAERRKRKAIKKAMKKAAKKAAKL